ncbi:MAG: SurA N-terminal domain-containing protein [Methylobacteriaceae bacterium]|nr:SurA N-terminal domain-containing protein [Methylobacteriaceae bacterium]
MLQGLRNASQNWIGRALMAVVMGFIVVSFAIWGIGDIFRGFGSGKLAQVGSVDISSQEYRTAYQNQLQRLQRQARRAITNDEARAIGLDREVLSQLVAQAALDQKARQLGLAMGEEDLAKAILNDPAFKGPNGQFDRNRFTNALRDFGYSERSFANERRQDYLRQEILQAVAGNLAVPQAMLEAINRYRNETRSIDFVVLPPSAAGDIPAPSDEVLQKYFDERKQNFRAPEYRRLVTLAVTPATAVDPQSISDADAQKVYDEAKDARFSTPERRDVQQIIFPDEAAAAEASAKVKSGATFESIAADRKLTQKDIELGLLTKSDIADSALAAAAFALPEGEVSPPVKTAFGYALLRVTKIEPGSAKPFADVSGELKREIAAQRAKSQVQKLHDAIEDQRSAGKALADAAKSAGLDARTIDAVDATGRDKDGKPVEGLVAGPDLLKAAFASDIGVDNDTVNTPDGGYVWFEIAGIEPAHERKLEEVKLQVEAAWRNDETQRILGEKAAAMVKELQGGGNFESLAGAASLQLQHSNEVRRSGTPGFTPAAIVQVFNVPSGGAGQAVAEGNGRIVFHVLDSVVQPVDPDKPESKQIAEQLKSGLTEDLISEYVRRLQNDYGVSVNSGALQAATGGDSGY